MKRIIVLAALFCLALPIAVSIGQQSIQTSVSPMHCKEFHFRVIATAGRATLPTAKFGRPNELTFSTTGMCSVLVYKTCPTGDTNLQAGRWERFGAGGPSGTTSVSDAFTWGDIGADSIRIHNYSGANILVRTWSWRR